jgi:hypothetical protein
VGQGSGNRIADGAGKDDKSLLKDQRGEGAFIHLPPKQREIIRQAMNEKLPPEFEALIQQYYINLSKGKPATTPATPQK